MTAQLRVRAGRHYRTDIWAGSIVGASIGVLVPALHRLPLSRIRGTEVATAGAATVLTMALSELVDFCGALGALGLCDFPPEVRLPRIHARSSARISWFLLPTVYEGGGGLQVTASL